MAVLKIKDSDGNVHEILSIKGDRGDDGKDAVTDQTYNPESENAQSGKAVAQAIANAGGGEKQWTLLHDITLTEAVNKVALDTNCKEVYIEGVFNMSEDKGGKSVSVYLDQKYRLVSNGASVDASDLKLYMQGEISIAPNGRLKGILGVDGNHLGYSRYPIKSTLSKNFVNEDGNIGAIEIQCITMEIGSTIKVWGR